MKTLCAVLMLCASLLETPFISGHGRLLEPPSRASAWRFGFNTPKNYNDNQLFCGGKGNQIRLEGKCGICGDPWNGRRDHEAGGKYATGTIVRSYKSGAVMPVTVDLTANHIGYYEFSICANNDVTKAATDDCFQILASPEGKTQFPIKSGITGKRRFHLQLPADLECSQCIVRWHYQTGNSWGCFNNPRKCCMGCGIQETFRGCADVQITKGEYKVPEPTPEPKQDDSIEDFCVAKANGVYPISSDCNNYFIQCANEETVIKPCPDQLYFNPWKKACDSYRNIPRC